MQNNVFMTTARSMKIFLTGTSNNIRLSEGILRPTETVYHIFSFWSKNKYKNELQKNKKCFNFKILQLTCHLSIFFKTHIFMQQRLILTLLISPFQKKPTNIPENKVKKKKKLVWFCKRSAVLCCNNAHPLFKARIF